MSAGWQGRPPHARFPSGLGEPREPGAAGWGEQPRDTGERLRAALAARSAQVGPDEPPPTEAYGSSEPGWRDSSRRPTGRASLFPRWAKLALAAGLVLSAVLGVVLGLHSSHHSTPALPPARETSYGEDRARVAIVAFYRQDKFVTLELELTNLAPLGSDNTWSVNNAFAGTGSFDLSGIRLLDPVSGGSYRPAEDGKGDCLCTSTVSLTIQAGSSSRVSAQFPAPAASVKQMTVDIPGVGSFPNVKLG